MVSEARVTLTDSFVGGYQKVVSQGINDNYFFLWMQAAGYVTYYTGKLWNGQTAKLYNNPPARGFNQSDLFVGSNVYTYFNVSHSKNFGPIQYSSGYYTTDLVNDNVVQDGGFIDQGIASGHPWVVVAAPIAPHVQTSGGTDTGGIPPIPATKYQDYFSDYKIPRTPDFNPDTVGPVCCLGTAE